MLNAFLLGTLLSAVFLILNLSSAQDVSTLRQAHVLYRHGDRSQSNSYPSDPYSPSDWPRGFGQLTTIGQQQHFNLGQYFRSRYINFTGPKYDPDQVYVRSSDYDRTIMSAMANLAGMFPMIGNEAWMEGLNWQPLPVHSVPKEYDNMVYVEGYCPKFYALYDKQVNSEEFTQMYEDNKEFIDKYVRVGGFEATTNVNDTMEHIWKIADPLFCQSVHNFTLPDWATEDVTTRLLYIYNQKYYFLFGTPDMMRLRAGTFFNEVITRMQETINGKRDKKIYFYSGHDVTVAAALFSMGVFNDVNVPYATAVILELHEVSGQFQVKILLKNETVTNPFGSPYELKITECPETCTYQDFVYIMKPVVFTGSFMDWQAECQDVPQKIPTWVSILIVTAVLLVLAIVIVFILLKRLCRRNDGYDTLPSRN